MNRRIIATLRNQSVDHYDIYIGETCIFTNWYILESDIEDAESGSGTIETSTLLKLKDAGFDTDDIVKLKKESII